MCFRVWEEGFEDGNEMLKKRNFYYFREQNTYN